MGSRGPAPKPSALCLIQGNPGHKALNRTEPLPPIAGDRAATPPDWLPPLAREVWLRLRPDLPWLSVADLDVFAAYCSVYARWRVAESKIGEGEGLIVIVRNDPPVDPVTKKPIPGAVGTIKYIQQNPFLAISQKNLLLMNKLGGELGLSPASRTRISIELDKPVEKKRTFG